MLPIAPASAVAEEPAAAPSTEMLPMTEGIGVCVNVQFDANAVEDAEQASAKITAERPVRPRTAALPIREIPFIAWPHPISAQSERFRIPMPSLGHTYPGLGKALRSALMDGN